MDLKTLEQGNIVKEFKIGNTTVKIADDYCRDKTPEDVQKILDRIAFNAQKALTAAYYAQHQAE